MGYKVDSIETPSPTFGGLVQNQCSLVKHAACVINRSPVPRAHAIHVQDLVESSAEEEGVVDYTWVANFDRGLMNFYTNEAEEGKYPHMHLPVYAETNVKDTPGSVCAETNVKDTPVPVCAETNVQQTPVQVWIRQPDGIRRRTSRFQDRDKVKGRCTDKADDKVRPGEG